MFFICFELLAVGALDSAALVPGRQSIPILNHFMCLKVELRLPGRPRGQIKRTYSPTAGQSDSSDHCVCSFLAPYAVKRSQGHKVDNVRFIKF
jgi:hypothetical protein